MYTIEVKNYDRILREFKKAPAMIDTELQRTIKDSGKILLRIEKEEVPVAKGSLRRSIGMKYHPIQVIVQPNKEYAIYVHEGTGVYGRSKRPITPKRAKYLRFKINGQWIYKKSVLGQKANPFVDRTAKKSASKINKKFDNLLDTIIKKL